LVGVGACFLALESLALVLSLASVRLSLSFLSFVIHVSSFVSSSCTSSSCTSLKTNSSASMISFVDFVAGGIYAGGGVTWWRYSSNSGLYMYLSSVETRTCFGLIMCCSISLIATYRSIVSIASSYRVARYVWYCVSLCLHVGLNLWNPFILYASSLYGLLPSNRKTKLSVSISSSFVPLYGLNPRGTRLPPVGGDIGIVFNVLVCIFFFVMLSGLCFVFCCCRNVWCAIIY
jgi:uncharacterized membrane protein YidH (DUF202 family)